MAKKDSKLYIFNGQEYYIKNGDPVPDGYDCGQSVYIWGK